MDRTMVKTVTHLIDYPPRGTACGLYYPERLYREGFGTYFVEKVTCKNCLKWIGRKNREEAEIRGI